ncbi:MAG: RluA family pseudouridine synthase [Rickettsiales bacterium]|nr:RluA family pseudouridine synthase [Rickettsiales bacterium]
MHKIEISESGYGQRLDKWLSGELAEISRSQVQRLIGEGALTLDGQICKDASLKLNPQHKELTLIIPEPVEMDLSPVEMDLDILFEDDDLVVINKPAGLTVHPAPGERNATLVHGLLAHCGDTLSGIGGVQRPGIVHRLDKDTSGAIIVAKHDVAHQYLAAQLKDRSLSRTYHALCYGCPMPMSGVVDAPIGRSSRDRKKMAVVEKGTGKEARTHYKVLHRYEGGLSLFECKLESGRTHQIRVHLSHLGHPLVGDPTYGRARKLANKELQQIIAPHKKQMLHAVGIAFLHPKTEELITLKAAYRQEFSELVQRLTLAN